MLPLILAALAAALGLLAGGPWWILLAALPAALPWRLPPAIAAVAIVALLPWGAGPWWSDLACAAAGVLAAWAPLHRLARLVPWVALPWFLGAALVLAFLWPVLPPEGYWADADVSVRARILVIAGLAAAMSAATFMPRYHDWTAPESDERGRRS